MTDETEEIHVPLRKDTKVVGAPRLINTDDSYVNRILNQHLGRLITGDSNKITIDGIDEITQQVVAGSLYRIKGHYIIEGQKKDCVVTVLVQPWITEESVIISGKCEDGSCYVTETYTCSPDSLYSTFMKREKRLMLFSQL